MDTAMTHSTHSIAPGARDEDASPADATPKARLGRTRRRMWVALATGLMVSLGSVAFVIAAPKADAIAAPVGLQWGATEATCNAVNKGIQVNAKTVGQPMLTSQTLGARISIWSVTQRRWVRNPSGYQVLNAVVPVDKLNLWAFYGTYYAPEAGFTALYRTSLPAESLVVYVDYAWYMNGMWSTRGERISTYTQSGGYYGSYQSATCRI